MPIIKKYRLKSPYPEDETFRVTITTTNTTTNAYSQEVDDNGNPINQRRSPEPIPPIVNIEQKITAVGIPSGAEANVKILETSDGPTSEAIEEEVKENVRNKPVRIDEIFRADRTNPIKM